MVFPSMALEGVQGEGLVATVLSAGFAEPFTGLAVKLWRGKEMHEAACAGSVSAL